MKYTVLIIEDEANLSNILADTLKNEGFKIYQSFNGEDGINSFYDINPDLILLDINLPKKNGCPFSMLFIIEMFLSWIC